MFSIISARKGLGVIFENCLGLVSGRDIRSGDSTKIINGRTIDGRRTPGLTEHGLNTDLVKTRGLVSRR